MYAAAFASRSQRQLFYLFWHCGYVSPFLGGQNVLDFIVGNIDVNVLLGIIVNSKYKQTHTFI